MKEMYNMTVDEVKASIMGKEGFLTDQEVEENKRRYGANVLAEEKKKSIGMVFLEQYKDFLVIILIAAAVISGALGDIGSSIVILIVITINSILGTVQTIKAEAALKGLKKMSSPYAKVFRNGEYIKVPTEELTIGDYVALEAGDYVPADGRIAKSSYLKVDESPLTGESTGVEKSETVIEENVTLGDRINMVYTGTFVTNGRCEFIVTSIGMNTEIGKIATLLKNTSERKTPLQKNLDTFGKRLSVMIIVFCLVLFSVSMIQGQELVNAFMFAVALAVAAIPEALSSIVTIVLSFGTQKMARENAIVRKLNAVEGLGSVSVICSDKTGTLTQNKMTVQHYYTLGKVIGCGSIDTENIQQGLLLKSSVLCNDAEWTEEKEIGDPTEIALVKLVADLGENYHQIRQENPRVEELPFDSDRKLMSTYNRGSLNGHGTTMYTKGAVDVLLKRCIKIWDNDVERDITSEDVRAVEECNQRFSQDGLRVLAFACKAADQHKSGDMEDENGLTFIGLISMMDPPRAESKAAVEECNAAGIKPVMITGDHKVTAVAIGRQLGIAQSEDEGCEGRVIDDMSDEELRNFVENISVYARVSPEHKIRIVKAWQDKGSVVAMTGDGVNDAPALKQADIGVAMGITGSEVSKDASSMILTDDNFATIVKAVENGRNIYNNIKNSILFLLSGNFGAILTVLYASVMALPLPFAPVHLLFINLLTDSLPAIALGLEPHDVKVMKEKPRSADESIMTREFISWVGIGGVSICITTVLGFLIGLNGWLMSDVAGGNSLLGSTMAFGVLCLSRLFHGFNCKSSRPVLFTEKIWNNKYLIGAFFLGALLITLAITLEPLQYVFQVQPLNGLQLAMVYGLSFLNIPIIQSIKIMTNRSKIH